MSRHAFTNCIATRPLCALVSSKAKFAKLGGCSHSPLHRHSLFNPTSHTPIPGSIWFNIEGYERPKGAKQPQGGEEFRAWLCGVVGSFVFPVRADSSVIGLDIQGFVD